MANRGRAWAPAIAWAAALFALSSIPGSDIPAVGVPHLDKLVHAAIYAVLGALCARALSRTTSLGRARLVGVAGLLATAYGITDELHQLLTPKRSSDALDVVADAVGGLVGAAWLATSIRRRGKSGPAL